VLEYAPDLIEAALLCAVQDHPDASAFHAQRDPLYEIAAPEAREASFQALNATWFVRLGLERTIDQALREQALILSHVLGCKVTGARAAREEGAELFVAPPGDSAPPAARRWIVLRLRPERLATSAALLAYLRHELLHIADMLDPAFGYHPVLPPSDADPTPERLRRDRYRVLWDTSIDGRLMRRGWAPVTVRDRRLWEFAQSFPMLGNHMAEAFAHFFDDGGTVTHTEIVRFARAPEVFLGCL